MKIERKGVEIVNFRIKEKKIMTKKNREKKR